MSSTLFDNNAITPQYQGDFKTNSLLSIPVAADPGRQIGAIVMNPAGTQLRVRKPDGSVGTITIA